MDFNKINHAANAELLDQLRLRAADAGSNDEIAFVDDEHFCIVRTPNMGKALEHAHRLGLNQPEAVAVALTWAVNRAYAIGRNTGEVVGRMEAKREVLKSLGLVIGNEGEVLALRSC